ncbi:hypothetical protein [Pedobacter sp. KLB.chiD]|uniref:hypothetical protein n=1 Tax=Pedobacter sp. KLB.chiD TaxID=3387402 RepID=UPI00399B97BD
MKYNLRHNFAGYHDETLLPVLKTMGISIFMDVQKANETPDDGMKAIKLGIQGLQTDHPKSLIDYLRAHKIRAGI